MEAITLLDLGNREFALDSDEVAVMDESDRAAYLQELRVQLSKAWAWWTRLQGLLNTALHSRKGSSSRCTNSTSFSGDAFQRSQH